MSAPHVVFLQKQMMLCQSHTTALQPTKRKGRQKCVTEEYMLHSTGYLEGCSPFLGDTVLKILQLPKAPFSTFGLFGQSKLSLQKHAPSEIVAFLSVSTANVTNFILEPYNLEPYKFCLSLLPYQSTSQLVL